MSGSPQKGTKINRLSRCRSTEAADLAAWMEGLPISDVGVDVARGGNGAVATGHAAATDIATAILGQGGNAADAAIAASAALCVTSPFATGLGGDLFALVEFAGDGRPQALNGSGPAPADADPGAFPGGIPRTGVKAATVPGYVAGLGALAERYATLPWPALLAPAHSLAQSGVAVSATFHGNIVEYAAALSSDAETAALFLPGAAPLAAGSLYRPTQLASTLARLADTGPGDFYRGTLAEAILADITERGGLFRAEDLGQMEAFWQEPLGASYRGVEVITQPPNSVGITLLLQLIALEAAGLDATRDEASFIEAGYRARRSAYRICAPVLADPAVGEAAGRSLLKDSVDAPPALDPPGTPAPVETKGLSTTNAVVMDRWGNTVSLIQSVTTPFGACVTLPRTGILLNNRMLGFKADAGHVNQVAPGKRPAHTLSPVLVRRDGKTVMALGTPGTAGQTCVLAQFLARVLARGERPEAAIDAPRWSVTPRGDPILEDSADPAVVAELADKIPALAVRPSGWLTFGSVKAVIRDDRAFTAYADWRRSARAGAD